MDTFWSSNGNKLLLEKLLYSYIRDNAPDTYPTVLGQVTRDDHNWQCIEAQGGSETVLTRLQSSMEEADLRIPVHILDSLIHGCKKCVVISNDTDVIVGLLYHLPTFQQYDLQELWVRAGVGDTTRYVPLHTLFQSLGRQLCAVLPALHSLTWCDITSKVGTKKAALNAEPQKYLLRFGESAQLTSRTITRTEQYLVKVLKKGSGAANLS